MINYWESKIFLLNFTLKLYVNSSRVHNAATTTNIKINSVK